MSEPPKPVTIKISLQLDNKTKDIEKQVMKSTKISDILAQIRGGLNTEQKAYEFSCFNDGIKLVETNTLDFYGIGDNDTIEVKGLNKPLAMARLSRVVPHEKDYQQIYLNSDKVGFLLKKKLSTVSGWKRRWVVLCRGFLFYYNNPKDEIPIGKMQIKEDCINFLGSDSEKQFVFSYENKPALYHFACESEEEYLSWKKCLVEHEPCVVSTVAMKMIQESTDFSVVLVNKKTKAWLMMNSGTVFCFDSPAESESLFEFYIHESKVLTIAAEKEFTFVHLNNQRSVKFSTLKEYEKWKKMLSDMIKMMGREMYTDSFITDEYKDRKNIVKEGFLLKEKLKKMQTRKKRWCVLTRNKLFYFDQKPDGKDKNVPFGCFDLLLARVELTKGPKGDEYLEIRTSEGEYQFTSQDPKELETWADLIQRECTGAPTNVQHLQHVTFDLEWDTSGSDPNEIFCLKEVLGTGSFGTVYRAVHRQSNFEMAIKILTVEKQQTDALKSEIDILKKCRSSNVVSYYGTIKIDEKTLWILMDLCAVGSVKDLMKKTMENLNEDQMRYVLNETLKGLVYLHSIKIIHHDIKAGNILLSLDGKVKLADFGVSQQYKDNEDKKADDFIGSPLFMSPEVIKKSFYDNKTDIWSLGITVIEMAEGNPPNRQVASFDQLLQCIEQKIPGFKNPKMWSSQLVDFVGKCLTFDYTQRPDAVTLLWHPFITSPATPVAQPLIDLINTSKK
ncbi:hypothetical protein EIN_406400 [Entamoeba invadens IP1]|uniref:non-specific serine/threonine protein kinase n=1 Tax=Entamoeba invadens IP1 TaxID=370355 RepID=A0A0A1UAG6_ENTIV|nr:hypothetical protein EIN_406400 [Entamoeba invadens IP1]ELP90176.1 hypothetical protein EIN_406400 [Entamoeba invadens IP1]|eukprot:XP_004256947.1 hypothetical protein EIN_406400 [Entamoeba invadens IP1]